MGSLLLPNWYLFLLQIRSFLLQNGYLLLLQMGSFGLFLVFFTKWTLLTKWVVSFKL